MQSVQQLMIPDVAGAAIVRISKDETSYFLTADSTTSVGEAVFFCCCAACVITNCYYVPSTASTPAAGSNNHVLLVQQYNGQGGAGSQVATATLANATPMSAMQAFTMGALTNTALPQGYMLSFKSTVTGTATLPHGILVVEYVVN